MTEPTTPAPETQETAAPPVREYNSEQYAKDLQERIQSLDIPNNGIPKFDRSEY